MPDNEICPRNKSKNMRNQTNVGFNLQLMNLVKLYFGFKYRSNLKIKVY